MKKQSTTSLDDISSLLDLMHEYLEKTYQQKMVNVCNCKYGFYNIYFQN